MLRVMIVEDEHFVRIGIKNSVPWETYGMQVVCDAENGRQALEQYQNWKPEIIITDLKMPVMNGIELMKTIRAKDKRARFIILTCLDEFGMVQEAIRLGASAYILKLTSEQEEIEAALEKVRAELEAFSGPGSSVQEQYVDRQAVNEQLLRDFLVYEKIPADSFSKFLEDAGIAMERIRILMVRFPNYTAMLSRQKDPLGYQLKHVVVDLLREAMEGLVPGQVYGLFCGNGGSRRGCGAGPAGYRREGKHDALFQRKRPDRSQRCRKLRRGAARSPKEGDSGN